MYRTAMLMDGRESMQDMPVSEIVCDECPMSVILSNKEIDILASEVIDSLVIKDSTGSFPGGPDSSKWPSRWFDAVKAAEIESRIIQFSQENFAKGFARA